jgi:hypothetical protein
MNQENQTSVPWRMQVQALFFNEPVIVFQKRAASAGQLSWLGISA